MNTNLFIGCDPDLHTMPIAWVDSSLACVRIDMIRNKTGGALEMTQALKRSSMWGGYDAFAVEAQEIYPSGPNRTKRPDDILHLGQVAGAAVCYLSDPDPASTSVGYFPLPCQWKGQLDKQAHHRRILTAAGIEEELWVYMGGPSGKYIAISKDAGISGQTDMNLGDYKHVVDAIGLAQYAATRYRDEKLKAKFLKETRHV